MFRPGGHAIGDRLSIYAALCGASQKYSQRSYCDHHSLRFVFNPEDDAAIARLTATIERIQQETKEGEQDPRTRDEARGAQA